MNPHEVRIHLEDRSEGSRFDPADPPAHIARILAGGEEEGVIPLEEGIIILHDLIFGFECDEIAWFHGFTVTRSVTILHV